MCARFTVLSDTPIASAIAGCVIPLSQQHHLDALAQLRISFPTQRRLQPPDLAFGAFDHLRTPNQMVPANHTQHPLENPRPRQRPVTADIFDSNSYGSGMSG